MFKRFHGWLKEQSPIERPDLVDLNIQKIVSNFGTTSETIDLNFQFPTATIVSSNYSAIPALTFPDDLSNLQPEVTSYENYFFVLSKPGTEEKPVPELILPPGILNMFEFLKAPGYSGKAYVMKGKEAVQQELPFDADTVDRSICRHGNHRYECAICEEEKEKKKKTKNPLAEKIKTVNVFDLVLPFLQPPFEHMLDQPILFPPGRRPFDYQVTGTRFLIERKTALLGDEMGLGKTIQTIIAVRILVRRREIKKILIVCPLSLLGNWEREIKKWAPELFVVKVRGEKELREVLWKTNSTIYITTYETLRDDTQRHIVSGAAFNLVVLDEVQRIKNPNAAISRAVLTLGPEYRWGLSGTPLENKIEDVIAIFQFLGPRVFRPNTMYAPNGVSRMIQPYFLRRRIADVMKELPEKHVSEVWLDLNDTQRKIYDAALAEAKETISLPGTTRIHIFALINQLKQICNLEPNSGDSCKVDYVQNELAEIIEGDYKALIFSQFPQKTLATLKNLLREYEPEIFHGGLSSAQREKLFTDFQDADSPKILLASIKAAGVGLNLTRANYVFHFDHWWNPAIARQAEARTWRIGQELPVFVHDIYTIDTVEERIYQILQEKQTLFDEVIDELSSEYIQRAFSDEDLYRIFDMQKPELVDTLTRAHANVKENSAEQLRKLTPKQFEQLVGKYYEKLKFIVTITGGANDQGVDIVARRISDIGEEHLIIQCKHYPNREIGPDIVREMLGTRESQRSATRAILVTSGSFSRGAIQLAEKHRINLIDGNSLIILLNKYQIPISLHNPK